MTGRLTPRRSSRPAVDPPVTSRGNAEPVVARLSVALPIIWSVELIVPDKVLIPGPPLAFTPVTPNLEPSSFEKSSEAMTIRELIRT